MVLYGVVPECHKSVSGMVSECIMSAKMVSLSASGTVGNWKWQIQLNSCLNIYA